MLKLTSHLCLAAMMIMAHDQIPNKKKANNFTAPNLFCGVQRRKNQPNREGPGATTEISQDPSTHTHKARKAWRPVQGTRSTLSMGDFKKPRPRSRSAKFVIQILASEGRTLTRVQSVFFLLAPPHTLVAARWRGANRPGAAVVWCSHHGFISRTKRSQSERPIAQVVFDCV